MCDKYVYQVLYKDMPVYVGSGNKDRLLHGNSGTSHKYELNRIHFTDADALKTLVIKDSLSTEESLKLEIDEISLQTPILNLAFTNKKALRDKYKKMVISLGYNINHIEFYIICMASVLVDDSNRLIIDKNVLSNFGLTKSRMESFIRNTGRSKKKPICIDYIATTCESYGSKSWIIKLKDEMSMKDIKSIPQVRVNKKENVVDILLSCNVDALSSGIVERYYNNIWLYSRKRFEYKRKYKVC